MILAPLELNLCFKGERDYLQGADLCQAIMEAAAGVLGTELNRIKINLHRFISRQPDLVWSGPNSSPLTPANPSAEFLAGSPSSNGRGWLVESERTVDCRIAFDETRIAAHCVDWRESVSVSGDCGYLPMEIVVYMTKRLHNRLRPSPSGRWILTKLDLGRLLRRDDASSVEIKLLEASSPRLTKSEIRVAGSLIGYIFFSLLGK